MKKLLIIGIAQDILETYYNAKTLMDLLKLVSIEFIVATDYKLCNILMGLSGHGGAFRCPFCKVRYNNFHEPNRCVTEHSLRTLGDIRYWARKFQEHCERSYPQDPSKGLKDAMDFYNQGGIKFKF